MPMMNGGYEGAGLWSAACPTSCSIPPLPHPLLGHQINQAHPLCCAVKHSHPQYLVIYILQMTIYLQPIIPHCKCSGHRAVCFLLPAARDDLYLSIHHFTRLHHTHSGLGKWIQWQHFKSLSLHNGGLSNQFIYLIIGPLLNNKLIIYRGHEIEFSQFYVQNFKAVPV